MCAYLAGFVDGEGSLTIAHTKPRGIGPSGCWDFRLAVFNSNLTILEKIQEHFGGFIQVRDRGNPNWKPAGQLTWTATSAVPVIEAIRPFLIGKAEQADLLLAAQKTRTPNNKTWDGLSKEVLEFRLEAKEKMHILNLKGPPKKAVGE